MQAISANERLDRNTTLHGNWNSKETPSVDAATHVCSAAWKAYISEINQDKLN